MSIPKYKEGGIEKAGRLDLMKPHIYWGKEVLEWLYEPFGTMRCIKSQRFCHAQDHRWTPRSKQ